MVSFGLKAAHEQFSPSQLLEHVALAQKYGFDSIWASDHFHPWSHTNAQSGFAWVWMASVLERTKNLSVGTGVTAPVLRYHPALVAQAFATLGQMYPGRVRLGLGTGEALNEVPLGFDWPSYSERVERLEEAVKIIRALWKGDFVSMRTKHYRLKKAKMYTKPGKPVPVYLAAFGTKMARLAGRLGDGFYSFLSQPSQYYRNTLFPMVKKGVEDAGKSFDKLGSSVEMLFSYDEDVEKAIQSSRFWAGSLMPMFFTHPISDPREIEEHGKKVGVEAMRKAWVITDDPDDITRKAEDCFEAGFKEVVFMSSSPDQTAAIELLGKRVVPNLREKYSRKR